MTPEVGNTYRVSLGERGSATVLLVGILGECGIADMQIKTGRIKSREEKFRGPGDFVCEYLERCEFSEANK